MIDLATVLLVTLERAAGKEPRLVPASVIFYMEGPG